MRLAPYSPATRLPHARTGTTLRTTDSAVNHEHFGSSSATHDRVGSYPQLRAVTLTAIPTHLVRDTDSAHARGRQRV
jgi:hypothetical protein